jgi:putative Mg2+ transporter-C (MgtC) family protein
MPIEAWDWVLRLSLAALLGAFVGIERESRGHPAGIRTQALVALAAALFTGVGTDGFAGIGVDSSRVASQVASGIGFIGAGVILKNRGSVKGLTTAATLFLSAALGVAVGAGVIFPAIFSAVIAIGIVYGLRLLKPMIRRSGLTTVEVEYTRGHGTMGPLLRTLQEAGYSIEDLEIDDDAEGGASLRRVRLEVFGDDDEDVEKTVRGAIGERPEIERISVEEL